METENKMAGYSELALGFVGGLNDIGPLIPAVAPDLKLSVRIVLEDAGSEARIDLGSRPPKVDFGQKLPPADITMSAKSKDFHDLLRGRLNLMQAWNDKKMLLEFVPTAFENIPVPGKAPSEPVLVPGFVYEMYLKSIGADKILEMPDNGDARVALAPRRKGWFEKAALGFAWFFGALTGVVLRIVSRRMAKAKESEGLPDIEWGPIEQMPRPGKPIEPPRFARAILAWFFDRVDMFKLARSFVGGARVTAPL